MNRHIFVFGSNRAGRHGAGAAYHARTKRGAIYGQGEGLQGESYAIPTKDHRIKTLPLAEIAAHVRDFLSFAKANPVLEFDVTRIGCGFAGYTDTDIAPLFRSHGPIPPNVHLPEGW